MPLSLVGRKHRQQYDGEHGQDNRQQRRTGLGERFIRGGRTSQADDFWINRIITQQCRRRHSAQSGDKRHNRQRKHGRDQSGKYHFPQHFKRLSSHVSRRLHGIVVNTPDSISQEQRMVAGAGKGHGEQHRVEPCKPAGIEIRECVSQS